MPYASKRAERDARGVTALFLEVPIDMREGIRSIAKAEDRTIGYIVRRALAAELARSEHRVTNVGAA